MPYSAQTIVAAAGAVFMLCAAEPTMAQTSGATLLGKAAFGDWHTDRPGTRRLITPADLPAPDPAESARNPSEPSRASMTQKPRVPKGFEVNLFASGLKSPRLIRVAPNGDMFVAESAAGRIRVLRPNGEQASQATSLPTASSVRSASRSIRPARTRNGSTSATPIRWSAIPTATAICRRAGRPR